MKPIYIGNDHGGYEMKTKLLPVLKERGVPVEDVGCHSTDIVRYPYYAAQVANAVLDGRAERGILICSTGIGMSIVANRQPGIRAALCTSHYMARMTRCHNDSNILCIGGRITGEFEAIDILGAWLDAEYEGGRHDISLGLICRAEEAIAEGGNWNPDIPEEQ